MPRRLCASVPRSRWLVCWRLLRGSSLDAALSRASLMIRGRVKERNPNWRHQMWSLHLHSYNNRRVAVIGRRPHPGRFWGRLVANDKPSSCLFCIGVVVDDGAFDLFDEVGDWDAAWAGVGAVEDGTAAPHAVALAEDGESFGGTLVAAVKDEAMRVDNRGGSNPVGVAPDGRAGAGTCAAQNAFCALVITVALGWTL